MLHSVIQFAVNCWSSKQTLSLNLPALPIPCRPAEVGVLRTQKGVNHDHVNQQGSGPTFGAHLDSKFTFHSLKGAREQQQQRQQQYEKLLQLSRLLKEAAASADAAV